DRGGGRRLLSRRTADAVRVPGGHRDGDPQGSAAPPRRAREPGDARPGRGARQDDARSARPRDCLGGRQRKCQALDEPGTIEPDRRSAPSYARSKSAWVWGPMRIKKSEGLMDLGLKGKVALVAGASKGLGYAVARVLAAEGAVVAISSRDGASIEQA